MRLAVTITLVCGLIAAVGCAYEETHPTAADSRFSSVLSIIPLSFKERGIWISDLERSMSVHQWRTPPPNAMSDDYQMAYLEATSALVRDWQVDAKPDAWRETFGFNSLDSSIIVRTGALVTHPFATVIHMGMYDANAITTRLSALGYERRNLGDFDYYSIRRDNEPGDDAVSELARATMNRVFTNESLIIRTGRTSDLEAVLRTAANDELSLADDRAVAALASSHQAALSFGILVPENVLGSPIQGSPLEKQEGWGTLHDWQAASLAYGVSSGSAWWSVSLYYDDQDAGEADRPELESRLRSYLSIAEGSQRSSEPFSDFCETISGRSREYAKASVLTVRCDLAASAPVAGWMQLAETRDLAFLVP